MFGDYIFDKLPDTAVVSASIGREKERIDYCKRRFLETLSTQLEKGPVGLRKGGHFVLVKGLSNDDQLLVNDSLKDKPGTIRPYEMTVSELFSGGEAKEELELVWLENLKGHEQEIAKEYDLRYDDQNREFSPIPGEMEKQVKEQSKNPETILHRNGVEGSAMLEDDVVAKIIYVPKKLKRDGDPEGRKPEQKKAEEKKEDKKAEVKQEEKKVEAKEADEQSTVQKLVSDALLGAMEELEQEEIQESVQEVKQKEKQKQKKALPATPEAYAKELSDIAEKNNETLDSKYRYVYASDPKSFISQGTQEHRHMRRQINMLAYFGKLDNSNMDDAFHALMVDTKRASANQKSLKAREYERIFEHILDIDISQFNIKTIEDAFSAEHMDAAVTAGALFDFQPSLMRDYEKLMKDPEVRCSLDENQFKEVKAKWDLIHSDLCWLGNAPKHAEVIRKNHLDLNELLKMDSIKLAELAMQGGSDGKKVDPELNAVYSWLMVTKNSWEQTGYKGPGDNVERLLQNMRTSDEYKLPKDQSYKESALKAIRARLAEDEGRLYDRIIDYSIEPTQEEQLSKLDEQFKETPVTKTALADMKKTAKAAYTVIEEQNNAISSSANKALKKETNDNRTFDTRGILTMLRPVKVNKDGIPATEQDMLNRKMNEEDVRNIGQNRLSARVDFLERVVSEARDIMFTTAELKDHKFILKNRERAVRHLRLMHNLLNLFRDHAGYFLNNASAETRDFMFMIGRGSDYVNYQAFHIQNALQAGGLGAVGLGGSSGTILALDYDGKVDYKTIVAENKKISQMGVSSAKMYVAQFKALVNSGEDPVKNPAKDPQMKKMLKAAEQEGKNQKITDPDLPSGEGLLLRKELPKGTVAITDQNREALMAKYLDCFATKNKSTLSKKKKDRAKLAGYIEEYKTQYQSKCENAHGLYDDLTPIQEGKLKEVDELYQGSGIPEEDLKEIKQVTIATEAYKQSILHALPEEKIAEAGEIPAFDKRGHLTMMRPVNVNAKGQPLTEKDRKNLELNIKDHESLKSGKLSDRQPYLDRVAREAAEIVFSSQQLESREYIMNHKEQAIRFISFVHDILNVYEDHKNYYLTQAEPELRIIMYLLAGATAYQEFAMQRLNSVLYGKGYGNALIGASTAPGSSLPYKKGMDYKKLRKENEKRAKITPADFTGYMITYNELVVDDIDPESKEGRERLKEYDKPGMASIDYMAKAEGYFTRREVGADKKKVVQTERRDIGYRYIDEYQQKRKDKAYIDRMLKLIEDYRNQEDHDYLKNHDNLIDDLKTK